MRIIKVISAVLLVLIALAMLPLMFLFATGRL